MATGLVGRLVDSCRSWIMPATSRDDERNRQKNQTPAPFIRIGYLELFLLFFFCSSHTPYFHFFPISLFLSNRSGGSIPLPEEDYLARVESLLVGHAERPPLNMQPRTRTHISLTGTLRKPEQPVLSYGDVENEQKRNLTSYNFHSSEMFRQFRRDSAHHFLDQKAQSIFIQRKISIHKVILINFWLSNANEHSN